MRRLFSILICSMILFTLAACGGNHNANVDPTADPATEAPVITSVPTEAPTEAPTETPTAAPTAKPVEILASRASLVTHPEVGTVYISPEGDMYAIQGENLDGIFGDAVCDDSILDGGTVHYIRPGSTPTLLDTDVEKACFLFYSRYESRYFGTYSESLVYLKKDGTVWLRGSNPYKIFGSFVRAEEPVKLLDGAVNIGADEFSVTVGLTDGTIIAWDVRERNRSGEPYVLARNADTSVLCGDRIYMSAEGELFIDTATGSEERFSFTSFGTGYASFGVCGVSFWSLSESGTVTLYRINSELKYEGQVLTEDAVFAASSCCARGMCFIQRNGVCRAYSMDGELMDSIGEAALAGVDGAGLWVIKADGTLSVSTGNGMRTIAENAVFAVTGAIPGMCLFETDDGRLWSYNFCTPEDAAADAPYEIAIP